MVDAYEVLKSLEPYLDAIVCFASDMNEHEPNRLAANAREVIRTSADNAKITKELVEAVGIFLNKDDRFQVMVGGNPNAVDEMIEHVAAVYAKAGGAS